jgi:hypothetical protein
MLVWSIGGMRRIQKDQTRFTVAVIYGGGSNSDSNVGSYVDRRGRDTCVILRWRWPSRSFGHSQCQKPTGLFVNKLLASPALLQGVTSLRGFTSGGQIKFAFYSNEPYVNLPIRQRRVRGLTRRFLRFKLTVSATWLYHNGSEREESEEAIPGMANNSMHWSNKPNWLGQLNLCWFVPPANFIT